MIQLDRTATHRRRQAGHAAGYDPRMLKTQESRDAWLFGTSIVLLIGAGLGLRDPWPADDPRFALVAAPDGRYRGLAVPDRRGELYADKPPLFMWLRATGFRELQMGASRSCCRRWSPPSARCPWSGSRHAACGPARRVCMPGTRCSSPPIHLAEPSARRSTRWWASPPCRSTAVRHLLAARTGDWIARVAWRPGAGVITKGVGVVALLVFVPAFCSLGRTLPGRMARPPRSAGWRAASERESLLNWAAGPMALRRPPTGKRRRGAAQAC